MIKMSIADIVDRFTIIELKYFKLSRDAYMDEFCIYLHEIIRLEGIDPYLKALRKINHYIWNIESAIRQAQEDNLGLEEVGRRALIIRDANARRIRVKNACARHFNEFEEFKTQYTMGKREVR
jgi:hypothetical protein